MNISNTPERFCALCKNEITDQNNSKEHIIPNSIGGRKKVKGFICMTCNTALGNEWDVEVARQLNWFSLCIGIKRDRGETPARVIETVTGQKILLRADGTKTIEHSIVKNPEHKNKTQFHIQARTIKEVNNIIKGIAKKYPNIDIEKMLAGVKLTKTHLPIPVFKETIEFGSPLFGRSIVKTAFAFASSHKIPHNICDQATSYLNNLLEEAESSNQ